MSDDVVEVTVRLEPEMLQALRSIRNDQVSKMEETLADGRTIEELQSEGDDEVLMDLIVSKYRSEIKRKNRTAYRTGPIGCDRRHSK